MTDSSRGGRFGHSTSPKCFVGSQFPSPGELLINDAVTHYRRALHKPAHGDTANSSQLIKAAVDEGIRRDAAEWALVSMQDYGWIELSIPTWGGVVGSVRNQQSQAPTNPTRLRPWYFGPQEYVVRLTEHFYNPRYCTTCTRPLDACDNRGSQCHDCRSSQGKMADLYVAIHASGDTPDRIDEWPTIRAFLRQAFGMDRTNQQLWEFMADLLRVNGWGIEQLLQTRYGEFVALLEAGLLSSIPRGSDAKVPRMGVERDNNQRSLEEIERNTPALDTESIKWIAARKKNQQKLGYPTSTLANYRLALYGGRQLSPYFGVDKDGRRWRRDTSKTAQSTVYYFAADVKKYQTKPSN